MESRDEFGAQRHFSEKKGLVGLVTKGKHDAWMSGKKKK